MKALDYLGLIGKEADIRTPVTPEEDALWPEAGGYLGGAGTVTAIRETGNSLGALEVTFADGTGAHIREDTEIAYISDGAANADPPRPTALTHAVLLDRKVTITYGGGRTVSGLVTRVSDLRRGGVEIVMWSDAANRTETVYLYGTETYSIGV